MLIIQMILNLPEPFRVYFMQLLSCSRLVIWYITGKPLPPPKPVKVQVILENAKNYNIENFIETGTYLGETIELTKEYFHEIYSVELDRELYQKAKKIFSKDKNIKIIHGDSSLVLGKLVKDIKRQSLFWLDAHYSGGITTKGLKDTPIAKELGAISKSKIKNHVILIDDAREFNGKGDYPTIREVKNFVAKNFSNYKIEIKDDIIRIYPYE